MIAIADRPRSRDIGYRLRKVSRGGKLWFVLAAIVPMIVWYSIFSIWALVQGLKLSFTTYHLVNPGLNKFIGLNNFRYVFQDPLFAHALGNSALWGLMSNGIGIPLCLGVAVCLVSVRRARNLYQTLIFLPVVLSLVSVVVLFRYLLDTQNGPIDNILAQAHLPTSTFMDSEHTALPTLVGFAIWKNWGTTIVILTAGLLNIPQDMLEAAQIDGASAWQRFWRVTLPLLQPTLNFVLIFGVIGALQVFTEPWVMTAGQGGPNYATYVLNMYIYQVGIGNLQFGQAAAAAVVEFAITLFLTLVVLRALRLKWSY